MRNVSAVVCLAALVCATSCRTSRVQESIRAPHDFDYKVSVIPTTGSTGNTLVFKLPDGSSADQLHVQPSEDTDSKRKLVAWTVDMSGLEGETVTLIQINFHQGTPFGYMVGGQEVDDSSGSGTSQVWKRVKLKQHLAAGLQFEYEVTVFTQTASGATKIYFKDPMVIVD